MTNLEKSSKRKVKSIKYQVEHGEKSIGTALREVEKLNDEGLLMQKDYEEIAEYLENLMEKEEKEEGNVEIPEEPVEEPSIEEPVVVENEQSDTETDSTDDIDTAETVTEESEAE